ncbi:MAG: PSD1 and planctomycete cytochrome C domain-containing protein [Phycisphaeraceae bacterium]
MNIHATLALGAGAGMVLLLMLTGHPGTPARAEEVGPGDAGERPVRFNRDIRPILSDACFSCHGFDADAREGDLRLDDEAEIFADRGGYAAVVPGDLEASEIFWRITADDAIDQMPPPDHKRQLSDEEITLIQRWIEQGAIWEDHWSFVQPSAPAAPAVDAQHEPWARNAIDAFVLRKLEKADLHPSPQADRRTLIRRLSFDLIGLPPTPEEVDAFLNDERPDAYERLVDRLLDSPHFGERMGMYWLDLVRYADTVGYHGDQEVTVWPYRDYVINAFNENKPFDQFTREQLAGDLLENPTQEQRVGAAYNRLGMMSGEGGGQDREYLLRYQADRVRNASAVWMGTTLGCAECHDHKYDPFSIEDFYRFSAFFADVKQMGIYHGGKWGEHMRVPSEQQQAELARIERELAVAREALHRETPELRQAMAEWEASAQPNWKVLAFASLHDKGGASLKTLDDGSVLATGDQGEHSTYELSLPLDQENVTAIRLDVLPHESLPSQGPGRAGNGNFVLTNFIVELERDGERQPVALHNATHTHAQAEQHTPSVSLDPDSPPNHGWAILPQAGQSNTAVFEVVEPIVKGGPATLHIRMEQLYSSHHAIGRFRLAVTDEPPPVRATDWAPELAEILDTPAEDRTAEHQAKLAERFRATTPMLAEERQLVQDLERQQQATTEAAPRMVATVPTEPMEIRVLPRGDWTDTSGEIVQPGVPHFLPQPEQPEGERLTRLDLANWLVSRENPLTARVFMNRLWAMYFNTGLSENLDDLGSQGEWPTHPELLDYLAMQFVDSGWDVKHMIRTIVTSSTYRQTSQSDSHLAERDPFNRLLARQSRFRIDAELLRDNALKISGLLEPIVGGRSVRPYQPPGYYAMLNFPTRKYQQDTGVNLWRRGLYTHWQRQYLHPSLMAFDAPARETCTAERPQSNTPLQALVLLNDPTYVEAARVFAERILSEAEPDTDARLSFAFRHALSREPQDDERRLLTDLYRQHLAEYRNDPGEAAELITIGERAAAEDLDAVEVAAWTSVARVILNLHETITRY